MDRKNLAILVLITVIALVAAEPALAGPGGKIARAVFESFWGKLALAVLTVIFLPLIIYVQVKEKRAERRARKDLQFMAAYGPQFDWLKIRQRIKDCFQRVHSGWEDEDLSGVADWMTDWYWQNQQLVYLEKWKQEGLRNVCKVKKINRIRPLLFAHRNGDKGHEDSRLVVLIEAKMQDYLEDRATGKLVEGSRKFKDVGTVWTFTLHGGQWKVDDIEEDNTVLAYIDMARDLPDIESTLVSELEA